MNWKEENKQLKRLFEFDDFSEAFAFMTRVAILAEQHQHHPTWSNTYNKVEIILTTHDEGSKVTEKDRQMAAAIDQLMV